MKITQQAIGTLFILTALLIQLHASRFGHIFSYNITAIVAFFFFALKGMQLCSLSLSNFEKLTQKHYLFLSFLSVGLIVNSAMGLFFIILFLATHQPISNMLFTWTACSLVSSFEGRINPFKFKK